MVKDRERRRYWKGEGGVRGGGLFGCYDLFGGDDDLSALFKCLGHDRVDRRHMDDRCLVTAPLDRADRLVESNEDGANGFHPDEILHELVADIPCVQVGEDEDVGLFFELTEWIVVDEALWIDSDIDPDLSLNHQVWHEWTGDLCGFSDLERFGLLGGAKVGEGEHRDARFDAVGANHFGCVCRDVCELFSCWIGVQFVYKWLNHCMANTSISYPEKRWNVLAWEF